MRWENGKGLPLSSHFSLTVRSLCKHRTVRTLLRGKGKHINRVQNILNVRSFGLKEKTGHFKVARETGAVHYGDCLREKFKLSYSFHCNLDYE